MSAPYGSEEYKREVAEERKRLEGDYGIVWNTEEVQRDFDILSFLAPSVSAVHKATGIKGILFFQHSPRFYFGFQPDDDYASRVDADGNFSIIKLV